jgi:hypothetical protein
MFSQTSARWSDATLEPLRDVGDPLADDVVQTIFADGQVAAVNQLIVTLVRNDVPPPDALPEAARTFFAETAVLPVWADEQQIRRGTALFGRHAARAMMILGHYSLPACYAARKGVQVLALTNRLARNPRPRLLETAQFVFDVMAPNGLAPGGAGVRSAQKVRLMHAGVRHLILQHEWNPANGLPINQEDQLGTLLTFSYAILDGLRKLGFSVSDADADAYIHTWNVIGALMGVREDILPASFTDAGQQQLAIGRRHFEPSAEGRELTARLVEMLCETGQGGPLANMPVSMMRFFLGDDVGDVLGLPKADWTRDLLAPMRLFGWLAAETQVRLPLVSEWSERFGTAMVEGMLQRERGGRAEFRIPESLRSTIRE